MIRIAKQILHNFDLVAFDFFKNNNLAHQRQTLTTRPPKAIAIYIYKYSKLCPLQVHKKVSSKCFFLCCCDLEILRSCLIQF